jgi:hypothetical protein
VWCEVSNKAGTVRTREATLTVKKVPVLNVSYPADVSIAVGGSGTVQVVIAEDGYPASYSYQWYMNGVAVSGATGNRWEILASSPVGARNVYCIVSNDAGSVQSRTATLSVVADYAFSNGVFHIGGSYGWTHNSETVAICEVTNVWHLGVDGTGYWGAAWSTIPVNVTGKNRLIFTVADILTTGNNSTGDGIGTARLGITNADNLGNLNFVAQTAFRTFDYAAPAEYSVDVSALSGNFFLKIAVDRTQTKHEQDHIYISAIRFE